MTNNYFLRIALSVDIAAFGVTAPTITPVVDIPLPDAAAHAFFELEKIVDLADSVPGDGEIEYKVPTTKTNLKLFGLTLGVATTELIDLKIVKKANGVTTTATPTEGEAPVEVAATPEALAQSAKDAAARLNQGA